MPRRCGQRAQFAEHRAFCLIRQRSQRVHRLTNLLRLGSGELRKYLIGSLTPQRLYQQGSFLTVPHALSGCRHLLDSVLLFLLFTHQRFDDRGHALRFQVTQAIFRRHLGNRCNICVPQCRFRRRAE
ncbi:MAG: hypothetical protein BWY76_01096 [bacterium ADurb.Bin429]|nr:MAG: hypothetical protein BWY76_01096 [bacterium ADurb.Bin429]